MAQLASMFAAQSVEAVEEGVERAHAKFLASFNDLVDTKLATAVAPLHNDFQALCDEVSVIRREVDVIQGAARDHPVPSTPGSTPPHPVRPRGVDGQPSSKGPRSASPSPSHRPRPASASRATSPSLADVLVPPDPARRLTPSTLVYLNLDHAMWTADMKAFVSALTPKVFLDNPPVLEPSQIRHQSSSNYCEVNFPTKEFAQRFIFWVASHPNTIDSHSNPITMFAKFSSSPKERAMGRLLIAAYRYIESHSVFDPAVMKYVHQSHDRDSFHPL